MSYNTGINRVFLLGNVYEKPHWEIISGERMLCFTLNTIEELKKGNGSYEHTERHSIRVFPDIIKSKVQIQQDDRVYVQGKIQTRVVYEDGVKLYKTEILATSIEHVEVKINSCGFRRGIRINNCAELARFAFENKLPG